MSLSRDKRLERAQMRVLFTVPFFAPGVAKLPVTWDETIPTACTDGLGIKWNPTWFDSLPDPTLTTVLCHEVQHCMLGHLWRAPGGCDWDVWNQATDHAVNLSLKEFSALVTQKRLADPFPFPDPQDAYCANPVYANKSEEEIYALIAANKGGGGSGQGGKQGGRGGSTQPNGGSTRPRGNSGPGNGRQNMPVFGEMTQPNGSGKAGVDQKKLKNDWENTLIQSCQIAKGRGELPAGFERLVGELTNPQVPWWEYLRSWIREQCSDDWNWLEPAMEYEGSGFIMPALKSEKMGPIVFATDTSGSIDHEMLKQFQTEKQNCLDDMRPSKLVDIYCDSAIHKVAEYRVGETIGKDAPGGGGTSFKPVWEHLKKMPETPKCVVYLTDLDGDFGEDPGIPVIWATWTKGGKAPFGEVVYGGAS